MTMTSNSNFKLIASISVSYQERRCVYSAGHAFKQWGFSISDDEITNATRWVLTQHWPEDGFKNERQRGKQQYATRSLLTITARWCGVFVTEVTSRSDFRQDVAWCGTLGARWFQTTAWPRTIHRSSSKVDVIRDQASCLTVTTP